MKTPPTRLLRFAADFTRKAAVCFVLLLCTLEGMAQSTDTDGDGMPNTWETSMGLNPSSAADKFLDKDSDGMTNYYEYVNGLHANDASDAMTDLDGDRIPNLWEFTRGTAPNDAGSAPAWDATVDGNIVANLPAQNKFKNFQDAYDSLPSGSYRSVVRVIPSYYSSGWTGVVTEKKVAWIADLGPEKVTLHAPPQGSGVVLTDDSVLDGFEITGGDYPLQHADIATDTLCICTRISGTVLPRVRFVNCIVRKGRHFDVLGLADALLVQNCHVVLEHCTFSDNNESSTGIPSRTMGAIHRQSGTLTVRNSVIWGNGVQIKYAGTVPTVVNSIVSDGVGGGSTVNPFLHDIGYLVGTVLTGTLDLVTPGLVTKDIHGQSRLIGAASDLGAEEWLDTDGDFLPDWWERHHFTNPNDPLVDPLRYNGMDGTADFDPYTAAIDGDLLNNFAEYGLGTDPNSPVIDKDRDEMDDVWEIQYFNGLFAESSNDADADGFSNLQEYRGEGNANPVLHWNDTDQDGLWDSQEQFYFESLLGVNYLLLQGYSDDFDGDGFSNGREMNIMGTNPTLAGAVENYLWIALCLGLNNGQTDPDGDGLDWAAEAALGTSPINADSDGDGSLDGVDPSPLQPDTTAMLVKLSVAGPPVLTLFAPPGAQQDY